MKTLSFLLVGILIGISAAVIEKLYFLIALLTILLFLLSFYRPFFLFLAMIFFLPFTHIGVLEAGKFSLQPSQILALCLTLALIFKSLDKKIGIASLVATPIDIPLLIFLMINVLSIYQSYHIPLDYRDFTTWGRNAPFYKSVTQMVWMMVGISSYYVTVNFLRDRNSIEKAVRVWIFSAGLVSAFAIYQFVGSYYNFPYAIESNLPPSRLPGHLTNFKVLMRGQSVSGEPSHFAIYLFSILPLCLTLMMHRNYLISQKWLKALFVIMCIGLIVTFSRTVVIYLPGMFILVCILRERTKQPAFQAIKIKSLLPRVGRVLFYLFLCIGTLTLLHFPSLTKVLKSQFTTIFTVNNFSNFQRLNSWWAALKMFFKHPLLGVGVGNYFMNYFYNIPWWFDKPLMPIWIKGARMPQVVNSIYLETLCETGIFGLISFILIFLFLLKGPFETLKAAKGTYWFGLSYGTILGVVGVLIGFSQSSAFYFPFVWTFMGLVTAVEKVAHNENRD